MILKSSRLNYFRNLSFRKLYISRHILNPLYAFLNFPLCLVVNNNLWGRWFPLNTFKLILKVVLVLFLTAVFSFFSCASDNFSFALPYSTIYANNRTFPAPLYNSNTVSFDCSRIVYRLIFVLSSPPKTPWSIVC